MACIVEHHQFCLETMSQKWRNNFKGQNIWTTDPNEKDNGKPMYLKKPGHQTLLHLSILRNRDIKCAAMSLLDFPHLKQIQ